MRSRISMLNAYLMQSSSKSSLFVLCFFISILSSCSFSSQVVSSAQGVSSNYFENKVFDTEPDVLFAEGVYTDKTNDTKRVVQALRRASKEDADGGVVVLRPSKKTENTRYRLGTIDFPSNVRLEIDPKVIVEMESKKNPFLFRFGRSKSKSNLMESRIRNVEIKSTHPTEYFTIDAKTNKPIEYTGGGTKETGVNKTRAIPVGFFYVENFAVSNVTIIDNHTESVSIQMYPDTNYEDGVYAIRSPGKTKKDRAKDIFLDGPGGKPLAMNDKGEFINASGSVIPDVEAIVRNPAYGRTPIKGTIRNIKAINSHTGYGTVQAYGGDWLLIENIESIKGIGVRIEAGNGTMKDNMNRSGPYFTSINNVEIKNVKVTGGFTAVWLKAHSKINTNISVHNVTAIDSATAVLVGKGTFPIECRDLRRGRFENTRITGRIELIRTGNGVAEVGNLATYLMTPEERKTISDTNGDGKVSQFDLPRNPSGKRWYVMQPIVPILALSQMSETEIGDQSDTRGFFTIDYSGAEIIGTNLLLDEKILYRESMGYQDGRSALKFINK